MSRLSYLEDQPIRYRGEAAVPWRVAYCLGPAPHDPDCVLFVSDYDLFGQPAPQVRDLRVSFGPSLPLMVDVETIRVPNE